jgi:hypothetical protein
VLAQSAYRAGTLRDKLGLAYPANRYSDNSRT